MTMASSHRRRSDEGAVASSPLAPTQRPTGSRRRTASSLFLCLTVSCGVTRAAAASAFLPSSARPPARWRHGRRLVVAPPAATTSKGGDGDGNLVKGEELFAALEGTFDYEGRLPSKAPPSVDDDDAALSPDDDATDDLNSRCGFVGIVGAPNMGKSTLLNALLETDLCVATSRPQTTRHAILGVLTLDDPSPVQLCFLDTPGVIGEPAYKLQEGMMEAVRGVFKDADVLLVVTDLFSTPIPDDVLFEKVRICGKPTVVIINKIDLASKVSKNSDANDAEGRTVTVPDAVARWRTLLPEALAILPASASDGPDDPGVVAARTILTGGPGVPAAIRALGRPIPGMFRPDASSPMGLTDEEARAIVPLSPPLYDADTLTDRTERFFASEMIRAALFENLGKELPYCCEVRVTAFKELEEGGKTKTRIEATVLVERDSQKGIVIGKGGTMIKAVGTAARAKLEEFFDAKIFLELNVKVDKDWRRNENKLKEYGYLKK